MHFTRASSRALLVAWSLAVAGAARAAPPAPPAASPASAATDAALIAAAKGQIPGAVIATARAELPGGLAALLVAAQPPGRDVPVSFALVVLSAEGGAYRLAGHDEVRTGKLLGAPTVGLAALAHPFAPGALTVTVGWKAEDGSSEEQLFLYRQAAGRLSRVLALEPTRLYAPRTGGAGARIELELLPTATAGYRDLRVRRLPCAPGGECGTPVEVRSWVFDGVRYAERPYAIPFVEKIVASSELVSAGAIEDHSAAAAIDGRPETAWCEGAPGPGWFQKLELTLSPAQQLRAVSILPPVGDWTRPKRVRILLPDKRKVEADLADERRPQRIALPEGDRVFGATLVIVDVYKGKREDACIAELDLEVSP